MGTIRKNDPALTGRPTSPLPSNSGFDIVIGNPPYIRQEWLAPYKPSFQREFQTYAGTADAYLYFFERGIQILKPGGRLGYITSGTFHSTNSAKPFRQWLSSTARFTHVVDFGNNNPFEDADIVSPMISVLQKDTTPRTFRYYFMRDKIPDSIAEAVEADGIDCDDSLFNQDEWRFQDRNITRLLDKLMATGKPLGELAGGEIYYGVKTGCNDAFIIDNATRNRMVQKEPKCAGILKKLLQGQDLRPWYYKDEGRWLIAIPSGWTINRVAANNEDEAWSWFFDEYTPIALHLQGFEKRARKRSDQGQFWWELRSCDYYDAFDEPKIMWPDIAKCPRFVWDGAGAFTNNTTYMMPAAPWLTCLLQSRVTWFCVSQLATPLQARAGLYRYRFFTQFIERLPIPDTTKADREVLGQLATQATEIANQRYQLHEQVRHRILTDLADGEGILNQKLTSWWDLDFPTFRKELKKALKTDIPLKERQDWEEALHDWQSQHQSHTTQLIQAETEINDRVYHLFHLTPEEIKTLHHHMDHAMINYPLGAV